ncbi:MAG TPA: flagellar hook-basal body complex protein FliE [Thermoleophilaceae bacterium]|jgi:flagellar hook-basal body complex protein FliE
MAIPPVDPSFSISGPEWGVGSVGQLQQPTQGAGQGFGGMLSNAISSLEKTQTDAASASQSLVAGTATDPTQVVMAVERARLSMQMASQIRTKAVEAFTDVFHTQI